MASRFYVEDDTWLVEVLRGAVVDVVGGVRAVLTTVSLGSNDSESVRWDGVESTDAIVSVDTTSWTPGADVFEIVAAVCLMTGALIRLATPLYVELQSRYTLRTTSSLWTSTLSEAAKAKCV